MSKQYKVAVVIGRFQPFHNQHAALITKGFEIANNVVVLVGGAFKPRTPKDPFTFIERTDMIGDWYLENHKSFGEAELAIQPIRDYMYSDTTWAENVQRTVAAEFTAENTEIVIVGCNKDESSFYLKMFPQWALHEEPYNEHIDATQIRELLYDDRSLDFLKGAVPAPTLKFLREFKETDVFKDIVHERDVVAKYRKSWERAPYPVNFVTVDACVVQSGHVLLIQRGSHPGKDLWAIPGGYLNVDERVQDGAIRELREETKLKVPSPVLIGSIKAKEVYDLPSRSLRGRVITHAFLFELPNGPLPKVKGSDDACSAKWVPFAELDESIMFEDHYHMVRDLLGKL